MVNKFHAFIHALTCYTKQNLTRMMPVTWKWFPKLYGNSNQNPSNEGIPIAV